MEIWADFLGGLLDGGRVKVISKIYEVPIRCDVHPVALNLEEHWDRVDNKYMSNRITEQYFLYKKIRGSNVGSYYYISGAWQHKISEVYYKEV